MKLEMRDRPGQLVAALKPISAVGGTSSRLFTRGGHDAAEALDVQIVLELPEGRLERLLELLRSRVSTSCASAKSGFSMNAR